MRYLLLALSFFAVAVAANDPSVLVPLYQYPIDGHWTQLVNTVRSHPDIEYVVIVNPNSGPGNAAYPDASYISAIAELNTFTNVHLIGYVHVTYANRNKTLVKQEIKRYKDWSTYAAANIRVNGIFFDEAPADNVPSQISYLADVVSYAWNNFNSGVVVTNQGRIPSNNTYFDDVDYVIIFESAYDALASRDFTTVPANLRSKTSFIIYAHPNNTATLSSSIEATVNQYVSVYGAGQLFITSRTFEENPFTAFGNTWDSFNTAFDAHNEVVEPTGDEPTLLVPLYQYPIDGHWTQLVNTVSSSPDVQFVVIVNPNSGPGASAYPDASYISAIAELNTFSNVQLVGYVHVTYATRNKTLVIEEIRRYKGWSTYAAADIHVNGIFLDESPADDVASEISYLADVSQKVYDSFPNGYVVTNQGRIPSNLAYFNNVDYVVVFENAYSALANVNLNSLPTALHGKASLIIYAHPNDATVTTTVNKWLDNYGAGQLYVTDRQFAENPFLTLGNTWDNFSAAFNSWMAANY